MSVDIDESDCNSGYGDFEDLQSGEIFSSSLKQVGKTNGTGIDDGDDDDCDDVGSSDDDSEDNDVIDARLRQENAERKATSRFKKEADNDQQFEVPLLLLFCIYINMCIFILCICALVSRMKVV